MLVHVGTPITARVWMRAIGSAQKRSVRVDGVKERIDCISDSELSLKIWG